MDRSDKDRQDTDSITETSSVIAASWNDSQERLLKGIAERSNCMRWLHTQCNLYFEYLNFYLTIPNVIISTLNGSFTMSLTSLFPDLDSQKAATTIIGLISIFSAVLITMNQYVKSQQMMEAHRSAGLSYSKLHRMIMNELSLRRDQRSNGLDFLKLVRQEIDRLENTAPSILPAIIKRFNIQFAESEIEKPEIAGDLDQVEVNHEKKRKKGECDSDKSDQTSEVSKSPLSLVGSQTYRLAKTATDLLFHHKHPRNPQVPPSPRLRRSNSLEVIDEQKDQEAENVIVGMTIEDVPKKKDP